MTVIRNSLFVIRDSLRKTQSGEIATILTLVSVGLMLMGVVVGKVAVQQTTKTQSKATASTCYPTKQDCIGTEPNCQDCTFLDDCTGDGSPGWQCTKYTWNWCQNKKYGAYIGTDDAKGPQGCQCDEANKIYVRWHMNCGGSCDVTTGANCPNTYPQEDRNCQAILKNAGTTCNFASGGRCHKDITPTNCDEISADPNNCPTGYDPGPCSINSSLIPTTYNICMGKKVGEYLEADASVGPQGCKCDNDNKIYVRWHLNCGGSCNLTTGVNCPNRYPKEDPLCKRILENAGTTCNFSSQPSAPPPAATATPPIPDFCGYPPCDSGTDAGRCNQCPGRPGYGLVPTATPAPPSEIDCMAYSSATDCKTKTSCTIDCTSCTIIGGESGYKCPTASKPECETKGGTCQTVTQCSADMNDYRGDYGCTAKDSSKPNCCAPNSSWNSTSSCGATTTDTQGRQCSSCKIDVTGACNFACCGSNSDCPSGEECGIPNGYCKNSGKSCGAKAKDQSEVLYVRMCGGGSSCAWTYCDGLNTDIKNCIPKAEVDKLLALTRTRPVTKDDKGILCLSNDECKSFVPTTAAGVNKCRLTGQATLEQAKQVDCPATYSQCYSDGKSVLVHRDCSQTNESGCLYWCESKDGKRTGCGPADGPDAKTIDDPSCGKSSGNNGDTTGKSADCHPFKCPDNPGKSFSVKDRKLYDSGDCLGNAVTSYSSICGGSIGDGCDLVSGGNGKGKCVADASQCTGPGFTGKAYPRWGPSNNDVDISLCSAQNKNLCCEPNTGPNGGFKPVPLPTIPSSQTSDTTTRTITTAGGCTYRNAPTEVEAGKTFSLIVENSSQRGAANIGMVFKKGTTSEAPQGGATADSSGNKWTFNGIKAPTEAGDWKLSFGWRCNDSGCNNTCDPIDIKVKATTSTTAPKCSSDVDNTSDIKPACADCLKKKIGESTLRTITECTTDNQKINKYCTKNIPTSIVQCGEFIAACASDCNTSSKVGSFLVPQSYDNESYNAVIEAIKLSRINAITASLYVLNATRVPGLQRLYCDPFKGQCDFYYQQNPQKGT